MSVKLPTRPASVWCTCTARSTPSRQFSTTPPCTVYVRNALRRILPKDRTVIPEYPYGPSRWFKQSNKGLYGGLFIQHGNNVGKKFGVKTRRTWHPNIQPHTLYSRALGRPIRLRVATRVLRTIDKLGGLDEYLVGSSSAARLRELGVTGWALRWRVLQTETMRRRFGISARELDWLRQARQERGLMGLGKGLGRQEDMGVLGQKRKDVAGEREDEVDEETKREVEAFDRALDEEDKKAGVEELRQVETAQSEGSKEQTAADSDKSEKEREPEMIQQSGGLMGRVKGLFGGKR
ncbi:MAG: 39S ribosomal protein L24, mitochondrial [Bathelium mastoideum]|nr:MAG: 39S ribosomal protein L24, mitochondrial [Bathelium mastoideum]